MRLKKKRFLKVYFVHNPQNSTFHYSFWVVSTLVHGLNGHGDLHGNFLQESENARAKIAANVVR
jgi:hypothetical protein